jgi:hypothetical protein
MVCHGGCEKKAERSHRMAFTDREDSALNKWFCVRFGGQTALRKAP